MRRNSLKKRKAKHQSLLAAEADLNNRKLAKVERKVLKAETDELALTLGSGVKVSEDAVGTAMAVAVPSASDIVMDGVKRAKLGRARKRNAERKKAEERRKKIRMRLRDAAEKDVDMVAADLDTPDSNFQLGSLTATDLSELMSGNGRPQKTDIGKSSGAIRKKSAARLRREERKEKTKMLRIDQVSAE